MPPFCEFRELSRAHSSSSSFSIRSVPFSFHSMCRFFGRFWIRNRPGNRQHCWRCHSGSFPSSCFWSQILFFEFSTTRKVPWQVRLVVNKIDWFPFEMLLFVKYHLGLSLRYVFSKNLSILDPTVKGVSKAFYSQSSIEFTFKCLSRVIMLWNDQIIALTMARWRNIVLKR